MPDLLIGEERAEAAKIRETFGDALVKVKQDRGSTYLCIQRDRILDVIQFLRDDADLQYNYFVELLGADYSRWTHERDLEGRFEVIYNLFSLKNNSRIFLKVAVDDGEKVPSLIPIFAGAEFPQREVTDLFGIIFAGHEPVPGKRFLLSDDWVGHPLRKEYPLGGDDVVFDKKQRGPAVEDLMVPHAGESFDGKTGTQDVSGR